MQNRQILWLGFLSTLGIMTTTTSVIAESLTNQSDYSGHQTYSKTSTPIDQDNGNGISPVTTYDPETGIISGGGINDPVESGYTVTSGFASGSGSGTTTDTTADTGTNSGDITATDTSEGSASGNENTIAIKGDASPQKITINDAAELLEASLSDSVDTLVAAEQAGSEANTIAESQAGEPRRIARNNTRRNTLSENARRIVRDSSACVSGCANPKRPTVEARQNEDLTIAEAREVVERQVGESQNFIKQVNSIDPEQNIW